MSCASPVALSPRSVTNTAVAVDAAYRAFLDRPRLSDQVVHELAVAAQAVLLQDLRVVWRDLDRVVEVHQRERLAVAVAVVGLGDVLADERVRQVALDARGRAVMRSFYPR